MIIVLDKWNHFKDRVDEYLEQYDELGGFSYQDIADAIMDSTVEVTLRSGNRYREATLNGVTYGVGYEYYNDNILIAKTLISPHDIELNKRGVVKVKRTRVEKFD